MKAIGRVIIYGVFAAVIALLILRTVGRPPEISAGPVVVGPSQQGFGPVKVTPHPSPTHQPFVAPTPFVRPYESAGVLELKRLVKANNAEAQCELGIRYLRGTEVTEDQKTARLLLAFAAAKKNACAINRLGNLRYDVGDYMPASEYYHRAADMGYPPSLYNLGLVARWGPQRDEVEAFKWFKAAAMRGFTPAYDFVGLGILDNRDGTGDPWAAQQWFLLGAKAGDDYAVYDLAWFYIYRSTEPDRYHEAMRWLHKATCECAPYEIGRLYEKGLGVPKDMKEAGIWYKRSADRGYAPAQAAYGDLLRFGRMGNAPDASGALPYYVKAADQQNGDAMYALAVMTEHGVAVPRDPAKAEAMYVAAAAHCSGDALFRLAQISARGSTRMPKNAEQAAALAMMSLKCGEEWKRAEALLKSLRTSIKDGAKVNRYYAQYRAAIYDYTGDSNFEPLGPLPPDVNGHGSTI